ncbi:MAG: DNA polymerase III subunit delta [Paludibacteraceae bacterium]|nr:DNA polymerase III subunit delta [Paludibacteraceae bacterium]
MPKESSYTKILNDLAQKKYRPVYLLMGDEPYYIDLISDYVQNNVLSEDQKGFDLLVLYGDQTSQAEVAAAARRCPMIAPLQVIIVKEAQILFKPKGPSGGTDDGTNALQFYAEKPSPTTLLVLCYKYGKLDVRKKLYSAVSKCGVIFESPALRDYQVVPWIQKYADAKKIPITPKATFLLAEHVGTNLSRLVGELEKLSIVLPKENPSITPELIESHIGISKDYNNFELQNAIGMRDVQRTMRIATYFGKNPNANPIFPTISVLFGFFYNLLIFHYSQDKANDQAMASRLGCNPHFIPDYRQAARNYSARKCMQNISILREYDGKGKGIGSTADNAELLKEMMFRLMHD